MRRRTADQQAAPLGSRRWLRYTAYEVAESPLPTLRPRAGARAEQYDPWQADREAPSEEERPYKQLLRLAQKADFSTTRFDVPRAQRKLLEQWVRHNGLLGILPHETLEYRTVPHWHETPLEEERTASRSRGVRQLAPYQLHIRRVGGSWMTRYARVGEQQPLRTARRGELVEPRFLSTSPEAAETAYRPWPEGEVTRSPLSERFATFFPARDGFSAHEREYPAPSNTAFWDDYGEPIGMLLRYARRLAEALAPFASPIEEDWQERNALLALRRINDAASPTALGAWLDEDDAVQLQWNSPSLFGCFAIMALEDLASGQRVMRCPVCGGVFLSSAHQAKFCSSTCRYTHHKRQQRKRASSEEAQV